jgi:nucleotide-binding universal stress UspA family protein
MSLCNILVHLNDGERTGVRLRIAIELARSSGARLTGVFARVTAAHLVGVVKDWPPSDYVAIANASRTAFESATQGLDAEWMDLNRGEETEIVQQMVDLARHFDVVVLGQYQSGDPLTPPDLHEQLITQSGRPVLVIPHTGEFQRVGARPIFAWADSRSSARGFSDGLLLVAKGTEALVVGLSKTNDAGAISYQKVSLKLAVAQLVAHGVEAKFEQITLSEIGLMDALLNRAADHGADLLSIGAFGGFRYPLFSRGGGSRYMLKHMTLPILFSH